MSFPMPFHQQRYLTSSIVQKTLVWPLVVSSWHDAITFCLMDVGTTSLRWPSSVHTNNPWGVRTTAFFSYHRLIRLTVSWTSGSSSYVVFQMLTSSVATIELLVNVDTSCAWSPSTIPSTASSFTLLLLDNASTKMFALLGCYTIVGCIEWKNQSRIQLIWAQ